MESESDMDAATALAQADQARGRLAASVSYPPGYVALASLQAALLMVGLTSAADAAPADGIRVLCGVLLLGSLALTGLNASRFERHNGARIQGLRWLGVSGGAYLAALSSLAVVLAMVVTSTSAWWAGLAAAPIVALATVIYLRTWLARYQRGAR